MDPRDDQRRQADLDWLYGTERPGPDQTRVMDASEQAELSRRRAQAARTGARAAAANTSSGPTATGPGRRPTRVVHREDELSSTRPGPASPAPAPARPAPARQRVVTVEEPGARPTSRPSVQKASSRPARTQEASSRPAPTPTASSRPARTQEAPDRPSRGRRRGGSSPAATAPRRRRPHWLRWLLLALVAWVAWLVVVPVIALSRSPQVHEQPTGQRPAQQPGTLTLLVGSDKRSGLTAQQQAELHTGGSSIEGERTDTMMLLFQPTTGKPVLVSLPRDTWAAIPGHGHNKLNAAYSMGGPQLLVSTVEGLTGLRVDNYLEVGFDGFANVVDALGGIRMCLDKPMVDEKSHTNLPAGCQDLAGTKALGYVRMRYADPSGDLGRVKRQRAMVAAIADKAASPMTFVNPVRYWRLNMAAGKGLTRGEDTSVAELPGIARAVVGISGGSKQSLTVPVSNPGAMKGGVSYVEWDEQQAADMFGRMARGDTTGLEQYAR